MKRSLKLFVVIIILFACKKEHDRAQWDISVLAPLFKATLKVDNLIADSITNTAANGAVTLVYNKDIYSTPVDSIFRIRDTTIYLSAQFPANFTLNPGFPFPVTVTPLQLTLSGAELTMAVIKKGHLRMIAKNHLAGNVIYNFYIPKAKLKGDSLKITKKLGPGTNTSPTVFDTLLDMTGYDIDLRGN